MALSHKVMDQMISGEISMLKIGEKGTWRIKVRGERVLSASLWFDGEKYITQDVHSENVMLSQLSMVRPLMKFTGI